MLGRHHTVGHAPQDDDHSVVVWRQTVSVGLNPRAEVAQRPGQIAVPAEREDRDDMVLERGAPGSHDRQSAGKADPHHPDTAVRREIALLREPQRRILDGVGHLGRNHVPREIRRADGDDRVAHGCEIAREADEARFVHAGRVHARHEQKRSSGSAPRQILARGKHATAPRDGQRLLVERARFPGGNRSRDSLHAGGSDDERGAADVVVPGYVARRQRKPQPKQGDEDDHRRASTPWHAGG